MRIPWRMAAGGLAGAVTGWGLAVAGLPALVKVPLLLAILMALPFSRTVSGRLVHGVLWFMGLSVVLWTLPVWIPGITHGAFALAVLGAAAGAGTAAAVARGHWRDLLPEFRVIDAVPLLGIGTAAAVALRPALRAVTLERALSFVSVPWDNSSHIAILLGMHRQQVALHYARTGPDGTQFMFTDYPIGYHAGAAGLLDIVAPGAGPTEALIGAAFVSGLLMVVAAVLPAAALAMIPQVRRSGLLGVVSVGGLGAVMLGGPGAMAIQDAHYNFAFAGAAMLACIFLTLGMERVFETVPVLSVLAGAVVVCCAWTPLAVLLVLVLAGVLLPFRACRYRCTRREAWVCAVALLVAAVVTVDQAIWVVTTVKTESLTDSAGRISVTGGRLTAAAMAGFAVMTVAAFRAPRQVARRAQWRYLGVVGLLVVVAYDRIATPLVTARGLLPYYPLKLGNAVFLLLLGLTIAALPFLLAPRWHRDGDPAAETPAVEGPSGGAEPSDGLERGSREPGRRRVLGTALSGAMALLAGLVPVFALGWQDSPVYGTSTPPTVISRRPELFPRPDLLRACERASREPADVQVFLLTRGPSDSHTCSGYRVTYTVKLARGFNTAIARKPAAAMRALEPTLRAGGVIVVTSPKQVDEARAALPSDLRHLVVSW